MLAFIARRLAGAVPTLLVLVTLAFFLVRAAPGGPFDEERVIPAEIAANLARAYSMDAPLWRQYVVYVGNLARGDFGPSFKYKDYSVSELIWGGFPVSLKLGGTAMLLALLVGVTMGMLAAFRPDTLVDRLLSGASMTGIVVPNFVVAPLLTLVFGVWLMWLPVAGWNGGAVRNMILPVVALALPQIAYIARLTRGSALEVLGSPFIRTARAKGLPPRLILARHALRGALLPVVSYLGPATAGIVTGSVVIEMIFGLPGIGRYFIEGAFNRDYTLVLGVVIFYGALIVVANLVVDLVYGALDPRVRHD
jgi:oligopeptide transport system permease protein